LCDTNCGRQRSRSFTGRKTDGGHNSSRIDVITTPSQDK
jgi:hypothetical protein